MAQELTTDGEVKPTRVQLLSNLAYDKLTRYLNELERKKMIIQSPLSMTEKGRDFLQDYDRIASFIIEMGLKYLNISEEKDIKSLQYTFLAFILYINNMGYLIAF
jgi:predicted transcriptional regulator